MTKQKYDNIITVLKARRAGVNKEMRRELKARFSQYDAWRRDYQIYDFGGGEVLVHTPSIGDDGVLPALDQSQRVSYYERLFDDLRGMHQVENQTHPKAHTLYGNVKKKYGKSIPRWMCQAIGDTCPRCIILRKTAAEKPSAGHQPIVTYGFGARGQVDLIDLQRMPDGEYKYLLVYRDHGTKFCRLAPLKRKTAAAVASVLKDIFYLFGPPAMLQSDNGREFHTAALDNRAKKLLLDDQFILDVVKEVRQLWPGCLLVRGKPRHSESNGGVERLNR